MSINLHGRIHWPTSILVIVAVLVIGVALLLAAIAMRRKLVAGSSLVLVAAALWNAAIVFAFMSPHNRHVFHLATHRASVIFNAAIGIVWLSLFFFCAVKWFRNPSGSNRS